MSTSVPPLTSGAARPSTAFQGATTGLLVANLDGTISSANDTMAGLLGLAPERVVGTNLFELLNPPEQICDLIEGLIGSGMSGERVVSLGSAGDIRLVLSAALVPSPDHTGTPQFLATARPAPESALVSDPADDATMIAASARVSGLVAHDLNNVLAVLLGACHLLETSRSDDAATRSDLDSLVAASTEAALIVRQLAAYGTARPSAPAPLAPDAELRRLAPMVGNLLACPVEVDLAAAAAGGTLLTDPAAFDDVVLTLALEARRTLGTGGRVTMQLAPSPAGDEWRLRVRTSAAGTNDRPSALDRPQASRPPRMAALGRLAVERWMAEQGGRVEIDGSASGFAAEVAWPRLAERPGEPPAASPPPPSTDARVVLVVDDNWRLRQFVERVLTANGYEVAVADNGASALEAIEARRFDAVVTDILMPDVSGWQVGEAAQRRDDGCGVVYVTGELVDVGEGAEAQAGGDQLLLKPFTASRLLETVGRACARRALA